MKLIYSVTLLLFLTVPVKGQKFPQEQFSFPPQFKPPNAGVFGSDSSIYLPPESHTSIPYFAMNNGNKLPFQFLPPTATKAPSLYPTPFPLMGMSSTPSFRRDEDDDDEDDDVRKITVPLATPPSSNNRNNNTRRNNDQSGGQIKSIPKTFNYQNPIDRIDIKFPVHSVSTQIPHNQNPTSQRRMIISSEILKNDHGPDQVKRASIQGPQFIGPVTYFSSTEPAIPILRLSNEMDLDGSFSYEALGADQTHYVQHSRMENSGTDKEEQVVEGSYSYVGDNGQTYTVHYVADSNGYRASGDHLPVAPPIPEIIQRAVQYNLAEEAKKPPHLKSWQDNEKDSESNESEKQRYSISPPRNLFTGRTPEAFSFGLSHTPIIQNNVASSETSQVPTKSSYEFSADLSKSKTNNGPISPQITFLASQGTHNPSAQNTGQQPISRMFANEKSTLPQLMNYEASSTNSDQENNKALWRWQYGLNSNIHSQNPLKNSISRSSGEGDDIIINFNDMTPEQYTKMIKGEYPEHNTEHPVPEKLIDNIDTTHVMKKSPDTNEHLNVEDQNEFSKANDVVHYKYSTPLQQEINFSTKSSISDTTSNDWNKDQHMQENDRSLYNNYVSPAAITTQSYDYSDNQYEFKKVTPKNIDVNAQTVDMFNTNLNKNEGNGLSTHNIWVNTEKPKIDKNVSINDPTSVNLKNIQFTDFIHRDDKSDFKPIVNFNLEKETIQNTTTTEMTPENIIRENYFLKNLFKSENNNLITKTEKIFEPMKPAMNKITLEPKYDKLPKYIIPYPSRPQNEIKNVLKKPLDMSDVINYITLKNYFESNKLKTSNKLSTPDKFNQRLERPQAFIPIKNDRDEEVDYFEDEASDPSNNLRSLNHQKQQELRGIIKNYKVLQRNSNTKNMGQNKDPFMTEAAQRQLKAMQTQNLPPLGRAGPSMKSYLPPTYL